MIFVCHCNPNLPLSIKRCFVSKSTNLHLGTNKKHGRSNDEFSTETIRSCMHGRGNKNWGSTRFGRSTVCDHNTLNLKEKIQLQGISCMHIQHVGISAGIVWVWTCFGNTFEKSCRARVENNVLQVLAGRHPETKLVRCKQPHFALTLWISWGDQKVIWVKSDSLLIVTARAQTRVEITVYTIPAANKCGKNFSPPTSKWYTCAHQQNW